MTDSTRPFLVVYIVWHPNFADGLAVAEILRQHFRRQLYENIAGGTGLSVIYRYVTAPESSQPMPIDLTDADTTAIIVLADNNLVQDTAWTSYVGELSNSANAAGLGTRIFPVEIDNDVLARLGIEEQAFLWARWEGELAERGRKLTTALTYAFCRLLRHYLEHLTHPEEEALEAYLKKVQIFLSHSKHDQHGEECYQQCKTEPLQQLKSEPLVYIMVPFWRHLDYKRRAYENSDFASARPLTASNSQTARYIA